MRLFLSYSRSELYFAESVVQKLVAAGFEVWFDIQQLNSGETWQDEIRKGLNECDGLVLIASRAALVSPYVAAEWEPVLVARKPVYVLVFEEVRFDCITLNGADGKAREVRLDQLKAEAAAIIDGRGRFDKNVHRLIETIQKRDNVTDPIPSPFELKFPGGRSFGVLPKRVSPGVGMVIAGLTLTLIGMLYLTLNILILVTPSFVSGLILTLLAVEQWLKFVQRRFVYNQTRFVMGLSAVTFPFVFRGMAGFAVLGILAGAFLMFLFSKDLLRWAPRGQGPQYLRTGVNPFRGWFSRHAFTPTGLKFILHHHPADRRIADRVRSAMKQAGFEEGWKEEGVSTDYRFVILSNCSQYSDFQDLAKTTDVLVCVVASPLGDSDQYKPFQIRQWVDFRSQNLSILRKVAEDLRKDRSNQIISELSLNIVPQNFSLHIVPGRVSFLSFLLLFAGGIAVGAASTIGNIFSVSTISGNDVFIALLFFLLPPLLIGVMCIWMSNRMVTRDITRRRLLIYMTLLLIASTLTPVTFVIVAGWMLAALIFLAVWMPLQPVKYSGSFLRLRRDKGLWRNGAVSYAVIALMMIGLTTTSPPFSTPTIDPAVVEYTPVSVEDTLSIRVPTQWLSLPVESEAERAELGRQTFELISFDVFTRKVAGIDPYAFSPMRARLQQHEYFEKTPAVPVWVTLYAPVDVEYIYGYAMISIWRLSTTPDDALEQLVANIPDAARDADCVTVPETGIHEHLNRYCVHGSQYLTLLDIHPQLYDDIRPVIDTIMESISDG